MCLKPICTDTGFLAAMLCPLHSCQCYAASKQRQAQQGPVASSGEQSQEGYCLCVCIPTPGYRGVQEDEPLAEGAVLRPPQDWQGVLLLMVLQISCDVHITGGTPCPRVAGAESAVNDVQLKALQIFMQSW